ncbi:MAG: hypothetical protein J5U17_05360 [Candidatus Methanoperedens sp.]|nr:hypothetical protein [Candidatus Methanoperedens sp.]
MSGSNRREGKDLLGFFSNESAWADFFITRIGLILFAAVLLALVFKVYPLFYERETEAMLDSIASDIRSKIEAMDSTAIQGYRYSHVFNEKNKDIKIEISTEFIISSINITTDNWNKKELRHIEPLIIHVYPPNRYFSNTTGLKAYLGNVICNGRNGDVSKPLDISKDKLNVDTMFDKIINELAQAPFSPDMDKPLIMEKVILAYSDKTDFQYEDYVLIYQ